MLVERSIDELAEDSRLRKRVEELEVALTACRPILTTLIATEYNVETWGLKGRLAALDAALGPERT